MYASDFETTTDKDDCRVWAWGVKNTETGFFMHGKDIFSFLDFCKEAPDTYAFHNLAFDGCFIIDALFRLGFGHTEKKLYDFSFKTTVSKFGKFYKIDVCWRAARSKVRQIKCSFIDSLKVFPFSIAELAKMLKLETQKGEIDYHKYRAPGHELTPDEIEYLYGDVDILYHGLKLRGSQDMKKLTIGGDAFAEYTDLIGGQGRFRKRFPKGRTSNRRKYTQSIQRWVYIFKQSVVRKNNRKYIVLGCEQSISLPVTV